MMRITCNRDLILARMARYYTSLDEEKAEIAKVNLLESQIQTLKNELWHAQNGVILASRIQRSCLDDVGWLQQFPPTGKQFLCIDKYEDKGIEITKGWRFRK